MKTAIYIRVSTEEQVKEGYSISAQKQKLKAYCIAQDWTVTGFYVDEGISAKNMERPELKRMMKDIEEGLIDCVLVYRLDRLTRSVLDLYKLLGEFEKHSCKFKSATEVFETTTAIGRMFITIVAAMAQWERENTGERIKMGFQEKVRQGKYASNIRPFGYNLDLKTGTLSINEEEAEVVRLIAKLYIGGMGGNAICKYLNKRGTTTGRGNSWNDKPLMQILKNPLYCGTITWGGIVSEDSIPPIIDKETFEQIQATLIRRRTMTPKQIHSNHIFSGKLKCPNCGYSMTGYYVNAKLVNGEQVKYNQYRCLHKKTGQCSGSRSVSERILEERFIDHLLSLDFRTASKEVAAKAEKDLNHPKEDKNDLLKKLDKIEARKKKWQYAWANDVISDEDFSKRMEEEKSLEEEIKKDLGEEDKTVEVISENEILEILSDIERNWSKLNQQEKKNFVQMFIKQINYEYQDKTLILNAVDFY